MPRYIFACLALQLLYQHPMIEQDEALIKMPPCHFEHHLQVLHAGLPAHFLSVHGHSVITKASSVGRLRVILFLALPPHKSDAHMQNRIERDSS